MREGEIEKWVGAAGRGLIREGDQRVGRESGGSETGRRESL